MSGGERHARSVSWIDRAAQATTRRSKIDLWRGEYLFTGLTCLGPGEEQEVHRHGGADKIYLVLRGVGTFSVDGQSFVAGEGELVPAPADAPHGVRNDGDRELVVLAVIAPPPGR